MKIHVVLVRTEYASNLGASARALANMGGERLILIDPQCKIDESAKQAAAGAQAPLREATIYNNWAEFYAQEGEGLRIALTRRGGRKRKVTALDRTLRGLKKKTPRHLYLIFGPEADGLNSEDLAFVNFTCHLPTHGDFASMNLAQAVLLALYVMRTQYPNPKARVHTGKTDDVVQPMYFPDALIREWLTAMGFDIQARRSSAYLTLRRLFLTNFPTRHEIQVLESILQQNIRKLKGDQSTLRRKS